MANIWTSREFTGENEIDVSPGAQNIYAPSARIWTAFENIARSTPLLRDDAFDLFRDAYQLQMRGSYRYNREVWHDVAESDLIIILVCQCRYPSHCHASTLADLFVRIAPKNCTYEGDVPPVQKPRARAERSKRTAHARARRPTDTQREDDLLVAARLLGLDAIPSAAQLKQAWRQTALRTHPDHNGSQESFVAARAAYEKLHKAIGAS